MTLRGFLLIFMVQTAALLAQEDGCTVGRSYFEGRQFEAAQQALWNCLESQPYAQRRSERLDGLYLAWTYRQLRNYEQGIQHADADAQRAPDDEDILYVGAYLRFRKNDVKNSMLWLSKAYDLDHDDWRVHQLFALSYISFNMNSVVEGELKKAIQLNPRWPELYYQLSRYYYTVRKYDKALQAAHDALNLTPDYAEVYDNLGQVYEATHDSKKAEENYKRAVEIDERHGLSNPVALVDYGRFLNTKTPGQGLPWLEKARNLDPDSALANYQLGRALRDIGRDDEAEACLRKVIAVDPNYASVYYILATLLRKRGDSKNATAMMNEFRLVKQNTEAIEGPDGSLASRHLY